jgi:peptide/nickel transport system permease protein
MGKYILRRLIIVIPMLFAISLVTFVVSNLAPGDPVTAMVDPSTMAGLPKDYFEKRLKELGLDKPMPVRYVIWLGQVVQGNLGYSYINGIPVVERIGIRVLPTLELAGAALLIGTVSGTILGVIAALRQYSLYDYVLTFLSLFGIAIPAFFFALVALYLFSYKIELFPAFGMTNADHGFSLIDNLYHLAMPAAILSIELMAGTARYARTAMLEVLHSDYMKTARAKGLSEYVVIGRHAFRNALLPLITITTLRLPFLFGGAIVIEFMFAWPGMGRLAIRSIEARDYMTLMGLTLVVAVVVLASNLLSDILHALTDPRIRTG